MAPKKLKGGALYIALIICMVTGITLGIFILIASFNQRRVLEYGSLSQLDFDLDGGFSLARSFFFNEAVNNKWTPGALNEDSVRVKKMQWGAYSMISVEAKDRHHFVKRSALYGTALCADTSIVVGEKGRPVGVAGKIKFTAAAYIPKGAIKPAYIEGQNYIADGPIGSFLRNAPAVVPAVSAQLVKDLKQTLETFNVSTDSLVYNLPENLKNDFSAKTVVFETQHLRLGSVRLKGNIKLKSGQAVLENTSVLDNILIVCDKLTIKKGFKGRVHVIARDSIIIEDECRLDYPSSLCLFRTEHTGNELSAIITGEKCVIYGSLIAVSAETASADRVPKVIIKLNSDTGIYGLVYSSGYAHLQGSVYGNVFCQALLLKTRSATYENHLLGVAIDPKAYRNSVVIPAILKEQTLNRCVKWL